MWDKMEVFYHVVKAGSFTKAEKILHKSQSALSRTVGLLEQLLGHRLLKRQIKGLILTRKGEEVFQSAQRMLMEVDGMKTNLDEKTGMTGRIRIATTYPIAAYILSDLLADFKIQYSNILIEIVCDDSLIDVVQKEVDIAICPYDPNRTELVQKYLFTITQKLYASSKYLKKYGEPQSYNNLESHKFIAHSRPDENPYSDLEWALKLGMPAGKKRIPEYLANSLECLFSAANKGIGIITSYEEMSILRNSGLTRVLSDLDGPSYKFYLVYSKKIENLERIMVLSEYLSKKLSIKEEKLKNNPKS